MGILGPMNPQFRDLETVCTNGHVVTHCCNPRTSYTGNGHVVTSYQNDFNGGTPMGGTQIYGNQIYENQVYENQMYENQLYGTEMGGTQMAFGSGTFPRTGRRSSPPPIIRYHHPQRYSTPAVFTRTALVCSPAKSVVHNPIVVHAPIKYSPHSPTNSPIKSALHSPNKSALCSPKKSALHSPSKSARASPTKASFSPKCGSPSRRGSGGMDWLRGIYLSAVFSWCQIRHRHRVKSVTFNKYIDTITYENVSISCNSCYARLVQEKRKDNEVSSV